MHALFACGVVALCSCEKNDNQEIAEPDFTQGSISQILADSSEVTSFSYEGKLLSQASYYKKESGELESYDKFEYDSNGRLLKTSTYSGSDNELLLEQTYVYNENGLVSRSNSNYYTGSTLAYSSYTTYEYNTSHKLEKKSVYEVEENAESEEGILKTYTTFETLPNGNFSIAQQFVVDANDEAVLFSTTTYSYDTNPNPLYQNAGPGATISSNNVISSTVEVHGTNKTYSYTFSYKYNEYGYPVSQTAKTADGIYETYTYQYNS